MILYQVCMEAQFDNDEDRVEMEKKHNIRIVNVTQYHINLCKAEGREYRGPNVYMFMGDWPDIIKYFLWDYYLEDIEQLKDLVVEIKPIEIG